MWVGLEKLESDGSGGPVQVCILLPSLSMIQWSHGCSGPYPASEGGDQHQGRDQALGTGAGHQERCPAGHRDVGEEVWGWQEPRSVSMASSLANISLVRFSHTRYCRSVDPYFLLTSDAVVGLPKAGGPVVTPSRTTPSGSTPQVRTEGLQV